MLGPVGAAAAHRGSLWASPFTIHLDGFTAKKVRAYYNPLPPRARPISSQGVHASSVETKDKAESTYPCAWSPQASKPPGDEDNTRQWRSRCLVLFLPWGAGPGSTRASGSHAILEHPPRPWECSKNPLRRLETDIKPRRIALFRLRTAAGRKSNNAAASPPYCFISSFLRCRARIGPRATATRPRGKPHGGDRPTGGAT